MKILIVGDFYPNPSLNSKLLNQKPEEIFGLFHQIIEESDLAVVNLECPLTSYNQVIPKTGPALKADRQYAGFLKNSGFGMATLANNHIMDYGPKGLQETMESLTKEKLDFVGAGINLYEAQKPFYFQDKSGKKLAILNFAENEWSSAKENYPGAVGFDTVSNFYSIQEAKKKADFLLLITHGGHENYHLPSRKFRDLLRFYIDAGVDAIVNHHPHCVSGFEFYKGKPIYYSIGNFIFDKVGGDGNITYWNKGLGVGIEFSEKSIQTNNYFFHQCQNNKIFDLLEGEREEQERRNLLSLNELIQDNEQLDQAFNLWRKKSEKYYNINIEPHSNRIIQAAQNRKLIPSLWSKRKKLYLLNMLRCESHRELLTSILENESSNTPK